VLRYFDDDDDDVIISLYYMAKHYFYIPPILVIWDRTNSQTGEFATGSSISVTEIQ
jgi:hypothetical protein